MPSLLSNQTQQSLLDSSYQFKIWIMIVFARISWDSTKISASLVCVMTQVKFDTGANAMASLIFFPLMKQKDRIYKLWLDGVYATLFLLKLVRENTLWLNTKRSNV